MSFLVNADIGLLSSQGIFALLWLTAIIRDVIIPLLVAMWVDHKDVHKVIKIFFSILILFFSTDIIQPESTTSFTVTNMVPKRIAQGGAIFAGNADSCKYKSFSPLNFGQLQTVTVPASCLPLTEIIATLNDGTICSGATGSMFDVKKVFVCPNGKGHCYVSVNQKCKEWFNSRRQLKI